MVLATLSRHIGKKNGRTITQLVREITGQLIPSQYTERVVRRQVAELREEGIAICAHPSTGYFIAETPEELEECCQFLRSRWMHTAMLEARLRKIALPELIGQMRLPS